MHNSTLTDNIVKAIRYVLFDGFLIVAITILATGALMCIERYSPVKQLSVKTGAWIFYWFKKKQI